MKKNKKKNDKLNYKINTNIESKMRTLSVILISIFLMAGCSKASELSEGNNSNPKAQRILEGESLVISVNDLSSQARFYPVEVDGVSMEVIAVEDADGNIRTAFNTCQICYGSGRGYYKQSGNALICQNCGNQFTVNQVEIESGGCNPWPIFSENKTVTEDSILISYNFLQQSNRIFSNWRTEF